MINNYRMYSNLSKERLKEVKGFTDKVEKFAKSILPKMGDNVKCFLDISELVGRGIVATLYIYGYNQMYDNEDEFNKLHSKSDMEKQVGSIIKSSIGKYDNISASTYWTAKKKFGNKSTEVGPYVEIEFDNDFVSECAQNISESKAAKVLSKDFFSKLSFALNKVLYDNDLDNGGIELKSNEVDSDGNVKELGLRINKKNNKALSFAKDFGFNKVSSVGAHSQDKPSDDELDFELEDKEDIARCIEYISKASGVKRLVSIKNIDEGSTRKVIEAKSVLSKEDEKELEKTLLKVFKVHESDIQEGKKKDGTPWTEDEIMDLMNRNDKVLYGALKYLYNEQTQDEKNTQSTREHNGKGFNALDAEFLSSLAQQVIQRGSLSDKQKMYARKKLVKYKKQLAKLANK